MCVCFSGDVEFTWQSLYFCRHHHDHYKKNPLPSFSNTLPDSTFIFSDIYGHIKYHIQSLFLNVLHASPQCTRKNSQ